MEITIRVTFRRTIEQTQTQSATVTVEKGTCLSEIQDEAAKMAEDHLNEDAWELESIIDKPYTMGDNEVVHMSQGE